MPRLSSRGACNNARAAETPLWYYILREADVRQGGPSWPLRLASARCCSVSDDRVAGVVDFVHRVAVCIVDVREATIRGMRYADRVVANERIVAHIHGTGWH